MVSRYPQEQGKLLTHGVNQDHHNNMHGTQMDG
jgi:hypothetical protein